MIIDSHTHYPFGEFKEMKDIVEIIRLAKKFGISKLCLLGDVFRYGSYPDEKQIKETNDLTIELTRKHPDFLVGFCYLNASNNPDFCLREIDRCIIQNGFKGVKFEISLNCRSKKMDAIMSKVTELDCAAFHHTWYKSTGKHEEESDPSDIADLATRFPDAKIVMPHLAGCGMRGVLDIMKHKNVYIDTSGAQPVSGIIEYAVEKLGAERILYGSDVVGRDFSAQLGRIYGAEISEKDRKKILGLNAQKLFKLN